MCSKSYPLQLALCSGTLPVSMQGCIELTSPIQICTCLTCVMCTQDLACFVNIALDNEGFLSFTIKANDDSARCLIPCVLKGSPRARNYGPGALVSPDCSWAALK